MKKLLLSLIAIVAIAMVANAQDMKIGVINVQEILQKAPQMAKISADLKKQFGPREQQLATAQKKLQADADNFKKNNAVMSDADRKAAEQKLMAEQQNLQQMQMSFQQDFLNAQNKQIQGLLDQIKSIVNQIAKKSSYSLIITSSSVAYADDSMDLTDQVINALK